LTKKAPYKGLGADSEEKREPVSDIDTAVVDSLKVLGPKRPIREADVAAARQWPIAFHATFGKRSFRAVPMSGWVYVAVRMKACAVRQQWRLGTCEVSQTYRLPYQRPRP